MTIFSKSSNQGSDMMCRPARSEVPSLTPPRPTTVLDKSSLSNGTGKNPKEGRSIIVERFRGTGRSRRTRWFPLQTFRSPGSPILFAMPYGPIMYDGFQLENTLHLLQLVRLLLSRLYIGMVAEMHSPTHETTNDHPDGSLQGS